MSPSWVKPDYVKLTTGSLNLESSSPPICAVGGPDVRIRSVPLFFNPGRPCTGTRQLRVRRCGRCYCSPRREVISITFSSIPFSPLRALFPFSTASACAHAKKIGGRCLQIYQSYGGSASVGKYILMRPDAVIRFCG